MFKLFVSYFILLLIQSRIELKDCESEAKPNCCYECSGKKATLA